MKNPLLEFKKYVVNRYYERNLRGLFPDGIKKGTVTIERDEKGHPYARFIAENEVRHVD